MRKLTFLIGGLAVSLVAASALLLWQPTNAAPSVAAMDHAMMAHEAPVPTATTTVAAANVVVIDDFRFGPAVLTVPVGTKVTWTNDDSDPHTVTSEAAPKLLKSPPLDTGDSFAFTFDKPGTYRYFCSIHPHMQGVVVVQ